MWARTSAGVLPGFFLTATLIGLVGQALPGAWEQTLVPGLIAFFPAWISVICTSVLFRSGKQAWGWLSGLAVAGLGLLWTLQMSGWIH